MSDRLHSETVYFHVLLLQHKTFISTSSTLFFSGRRWRRAWQRCRSTPPSPTWRRSNLMMRVCHCSLFQLFQLPSLHNRDNEKERKRSKPHRYLMGLLRSKQSRITPESNKTKNKQTLIRIRQQSHGRCLMKTQQDFFLLKTEPRGSRARVWPDIS